MKLIIYKGFNEEFLSKVEKEPLLDNPISEKTNALLFDKKMRKQLNMQLLSLEDEDEVWATYEEYTLLKAQIDALVDEDGLELIIYRNNLYPDYYPLSFEMDQTLVEEINAHINGERADEQSEECQRYVSIYNSIISVEGVLYSSFYNYEYDREENLDVKDFYPSNAHIDETHDETDFNVYINDDAETYLRDLARIKVLKPSVIGVKSTDGLVSNRIYLSLQAYCIANNIRLVNYYEQLPEDVELENTLKDIAINDISIKGFTDFRKIQFYKNPDIDKEVIEIPQSQIIQEIIRQAERSYDDNNGNRFRDIFITASTGAGKSVMFQIPAVYLAKKYNKLTIIIEPVKALMQDQKERLISNGYTRVEAFNSDLISQVEKEAVLKKIKGGEVDLLYLSPETLLSYSIETIIGDREIGLLIVDEAHIVTTWGVGFRPDYWYLGSYINRLRNQIQTSRGMKQKVYHFPICAFTATAINGGVDDSVSDTVISLNMENPIKYIGYVRRDDIHFDITKRSVTKLPKSSYEEGKCKALSDRIDTWLAKNEKTIVYFPYASLASEAAKGIRAFAGITTDKRIGLYTGRNIEETSTEIFNAGKREVFENFRNGTTSIIFATKAFGMGVDVNDVKNVYHYATTGNLSDYVQEIGRAARMKSMTGNAVTDYFYNDLNFMKVLFGMSQIKQYQVKKVLEGIYDTYKAKKGARSFLISPQSFTYIFNGKGVQDEGRCINKLKTCLLMIEKDFYDKYNFKVLVSRPQSVFTKAFVVINRDHEKEVLESKYGKCFKFISKGRKSIPQKDGSLLSDTGDIYAIDLKQIWEEFNPNISFPQFKYWYFNVNSHSRDKVDIMPEIRTFFSPRQKVNVEARGDRLLNVLRDEILNDFEYIADTLYANHGKSFFSIEDVVRDIQEKYGQSQARIIANSLFDLVDPDGRCVKHSVRDSSGKTYYSLAFGNFKEYMRRPIIRSTIIGYLSREESASYSGFLNMTSDDSSNVALKLLSIFDYITYEILGGQEPEIFIRLNDPNKIKGIVYGSIYYSNNYITRAKQKHDRDVSVLMHFFNDLKSDDERWNYIEDYFLGYDVLANTEPVVISPVKMTKMIDKERSYQTTQFSSWDDFSNYYDENDHVIIDKMAAAGLPIPEYLETAIKKADWGEHIVMCWPSKDTMICQQEISDGLMESLFKKGWHVYRIYDIDIEKLKEDLR